MKIPKETLERLKDNLKKHAPEIFSPALPYEAFAWVYEMDEETRERMRKTVEEAQQKYWDDACKDTFEEGD